MAAKINIFHLYFAILLAVFIYVILCEAPQSVIAAIKGKDKTGLSLVGHFTRRYPCRAVLPSEEDKMWHRCKDSMVEGGNRYVCNDYSKQPPPTNATEEEIEMFHQYFAGFKLRWCPVDDPDHSWMLCACIRDAQMLTPKPTKAKTKKPTKGEYEVYDDENKDGHTATSPSQSSTSNTDSPTIQTESPAVKPVINSPSKSPIIATKSPTTKSPESIQPTHKPAYSPTISEYDSVNGKSREKEENDGHYNATVKGPSTDKNNTIGESFMGGTFGTFVLVMISSVIIFAVFRKYRSSNRISPNIAYQQTGTHPTTTDNHGIIELDTSDSWSRGVNSNSRGQGFFFSGANGDRL